MRLNKVDRKNRMFNWGKFVFNIGRRGFTCTKIFVISAWKVVFVFVMSCLWKRDSGESVILQASCDSCKEHKKRIDDLEQNLKQTIKRVDAVNRENEVLKQQNDKIRERSDNITSTMADILETKGDLENVNDEFANSKLTKTFETLYDNKWTALSEWIDENNPELNELERIKSLTKLSKNAYAECVRLAEEQLRHFLFLDEKDKIPSPKDEPALFKVRRTGGQQPLTRDVVKKNVMDKVLIADDIQVFYTEEKREETKIKLEGFFSEFIDCCWLMTISNPVLLLKFDVVGQAYLGNVKERFKQYSCQEQVECVDYVKDTVFEVVWPSVELEDSSGIYAKGDVVTVDIGRQN